MHIAAERQFFVGEYFPRLTFQLVNARQFSRFFVLRGKHEKRVTAGQIAARVVNFLRGFWSPNANTICNQAPNSPSRFAFHRP